MYLVAFWEVQLVSLPAQKLALSAVSSARSLEYLFSQQSVWLGDGVPVLTLYAQFSDGEGSVGQKWPLANHFLRRALANIADIRAWYDWVVSAVVKKSYTLWAVYRGCHVESIGG